MSRPLMTACAAGLCMALTLGFNAWADDASSSAQAPKTGSVNKEIGKGTAHQTSLPSSAAAASPQRQTGTSAQSGAVKTMNKQAKDKVEAEGK